jgi:hypothetical protein
MVNPILLWINILWMIPLLKNKRYLVSEKLISRKIPSCLFRIHYGLYNQPHQSFTSDENILKFPIFQRTIQRYVYFLDIQIFLKNIFLFIIFQQITECGFILWDKVLITIINMVLVVHGFIMCHIWDKCNVLCPFNDSIVFNCRYIKQI